MDMDSKSAVRRLLKDRVAALAATERASKSSVACSWVSHSAEFAAAQVVMLYVSLPDEVDTAALALRCWQSGKTVVVPKVAWGQRRMLPVEISCLQTGMTRNPGGVEEPTAGKPVPLDLIDLVIVPGLGFTPQGNRIGRGMGFYDRFLAQDEFVGRTCGLGFETQVLDQLPTLEHDVPLGMLVTEIGVRRFSQVTIQQG